MRLFSVVALVAVLSAAAFADEGIEEHRNRCITMESSDKQVTLVAAPIEETNWYLNPHAAKWVPDSVKTAVHESYKTIEISTQTLGERGRLPLSVTARCRETSNNQFNYATVQSYKNWKENKREFMTNIFDIHSKPLYGYDSTNAYNVLALIQEGKTDLDEYEADQILVSRTFEFDFEWWYVGVSFKMAFDTIIDGVQKHGTKLITSLSVGYDSLLTFNSAKDNFLHPSNPGHVPPDTLKTARVQMIKVSLVDPERLPSSSSVVTQSSSSVVTQSSSSVAGSSGSNDQPKSSANEPESSASEQPKSSAEQSSSSSKDSPKSSASEPESSSSTGEDKPKSSAGESSSSGGKTSIAIMRNEAVDDDIVEMRGLDGTLVKRNADVKPGIYYAKTSRGIWIRKAVMPR